MADQEFQVLVTNTDYEKLKLHQSENKTLLKQIVKLNQQITTLKQKNKDLTRSVYVRDSFIDYVANQCDYTFGTILSLNIISSDITQSFYQDVVSHEQNGISSIQLREALQLYIKKNQRVFDRLRQIQNKFMELESKIKILELKKVQSSSQAKIVEHLSKIKETKPQNKPQASQIQQSTQEAAKLASQINHLHIQIDKLEQHKHKLVKESEDIKRKNVELNKQIQALIKKRDTQGQKNYVIKLMIDEYYRQLELNLVKLGGLSDNEIGTVVANQMKGIVHYINNLAKKANKHI